MSGRGRTTKARAGFTLVELMIAMLAGSFAVTGVYYLSGVSSRGYQDQMRVSETQQALRSAMEQLRRDISRAGYLATPSSTLIPDCSGTIATPTSPDIAPRWVRALQVTPDGSLTNNTVKTLLAPTVNQTRADVLRLWGNYATADAYLADPRITTSTRIYFQELSESFRRSFCVPQLGNAEAVCDGTRFGEVFQVGRMLRVEQNGRFFFRDITNVATAPTPYVDIDPLPSCFEPTAWTAVAPVLRIRYQVEPDNADQEFSRLNLVPQDSERAASPALPGTRRTILVRREERDVDGAVIAQRSRMVLDYAVEFAVDAIVNDLAFAADPPAWVQRTGANVLTESTTRPENFRSLIVTLSSRSTDADPRLRRIPRARFARANLLDSPLRGFQVVDLTNENLVLHSRVRTMRSEIFLQNL